MQSFRSKEINKTKIKKKKKKSVSHFLKSYLIIRKRRKEKILITPRKLSYMKYEKEIERGNVLVDRL